MSRHRRPIMNKTIPADLRKAAKTMAREKGIPHQTALDMLAQQAGHAGWGALLANKRMPIDPLHRLVLQLWEAGGTDLHIEPWTGLDMDRNDAGRDPHEGPMTNQERHLLLSHLSTMVTAMVPVETALRILSENQERRISRTAMMLAKAVASGGDLAMTMSQDPENFPGETGAILGSGSAGPVEMIQALKRAVRHEEEIRAQAIERHSEKDGTIRKGASVLFRVHGRRRLITTLDPDAFDALRTAIVPCMRDWNDARPGEGAISMRIEGRACSFPIASFPTNGSSKFVVRIPDRWIAGLTLEDLGIRELDAWMRICRSGPGIVMISGKTNSGKSTTIAKTIERLRAEGIDAISEEANAPFHENRAAEMLEAARTRTVLLEGFGSSLDRGIANAMAMGLGNGGLAKRFLGGIHQQLHMNSVGPRTLDASVLPWV